MEPLPSGCGREQKSSLVPSRPAPAPPKLGSHNQETSHANAKAPAPPSSRAGGGGGWRGRSWMLKVLHGGNQPLGVGNTGEEAGAGGGSRSRVEPTHPCPACLSAAAPAVRTRQRQVSGLANASTVVLGLSSYHPTYKVFISSLLGSRRSSSSTIKPEQPRRMLWIAHAALPLQGAEFSPILLLPLLAGVKPALPTLTSSSQP